MGIIYLIIMPTFIIAYMARILTGKGKNKKPNILLSLILVSIFVLVAGLRSSLGDTSAYVHTYANITEETDIFKSSYEAGFMLFLLFLRRFSSDPQFMIFVTAAITNVLNIWLIRKYSEDSYFELSIFMYIAAGTYVVTMNGIRQCLVASLIFASTILIIKRKLISYCIVILLLSTIHSSALIMIVVYFIAIKEAWSKDIIKVIILFLVCMILYEPLMNIIFGILGNSKFGQYKDFNEGGANILRIAVSGVPVFLAFIKRDILKDKWKNSNIFINISLVNFIIMSFSYFNWIFARFNLYTEIYSIVLLPYIIKNCFQNKKERRLLYYSLIVAYFIYFYFETISGDVVYRSNFNILNLFYYISN